MERHPLKFDGRWLWHNHDHPAAEKEGNYPDHLPGHIFERLTGFMPRPDRVTALVKSYPTREEAEAAYQRALATVPAETEGA